MELSLLEDCIGQYEGYTCSNIQYVLAVSCWSSWECVISLSSALLCFSHTLAIDFQGILRKPCFLIRCRVVSHLGMLQPFKPSLDNHSLPETKASFWPSHATLVQNRIKTACFQAFPSNRHNLKKGPGPSGTR